jgi:hypothetical protein
LGKNCGNVLSNLVGWATFASSGNPSSGAEMHPLLPNNISKIIFFLVEFKLVGSLGKHRRFSLFFIDLPVNLFENLETSWRIPGIVCLHQQVGTLIYA